MLNRIRSVVVVGLGYIGLPTAALLASRGYSVLGFDIKPDIIDIINSRNIHIVEPELKDLVQSAVHQGKLKAALAPVPADVFIIAVPTPIKKDLSPDISYVETAVRTIAPFLQPENLIILESTSPVGTTEKLVEWISECRPDLIHRKELNVSVACCPERVLPGRVLRELIENNRVIGGINAVSTERAKSFYQTFVTGKIFTTDSKTAEMCKLTENAYRDVNIAFANELAHLCENMNINVWELIALANQHPRVNILNPGPGVGGHCIAVDPWFIVNAHPNDSHLIRTARNINDRRPLQILQHIESQAKRIKNPKIGCLGLSFKANIDDLRESPAVFIVEQLLERNIGEVLVVEPHIRDLPDTLKQYSQIKLVDFEHCIEHSDMLALLVDHQYFADMNLKEIPHKWIIDTRGIWHDASINSTG